MIRHGDIQIVKVEKMPADVKKLNRKELAYGEVTGHAHRIDVGEIFETRDGELYLKVKELSKVSHEEHKTVALGHGIYHICTKRQYTTNGWQKVQD
jgi:hypothetical protein